MFITHLKCLILSVYNSLFKCLNKVPHYNINDSMKKDFLNMHKDSVFTDILSESS